MTDISSTTSNTNTIANLNIVPRSSDISTDQSVNTQTANVANTVTPTVATPFSTVLTSTLGDAQNYASLLTQANNDIKNILKNAVDNNTSVDQAALQDAQARQTLNTHLLQSALQGLYAQLTKSNATITADQLKPLEDTMNNTVTLLVKAQQDANNLTQAILKVNNILYNANSGGTSNQTDLQTAQNQKTLAAQQLKVSIDALKAQLSPPTQTALQPLEHVLFLSTLTLTDQDFNTASVNAYNQVYKNYSSDLSNILKHLGLTSQPSTTDPNWGDWVTFDNQGNISVLKNPKSLNDALIALRNNYFASTPATKNVLFPLSQGSTISGGNWADVQEFAVRMGYMSRSDVKDSPPATLPSYIQAITTSTPTTYVVTLDKGQLDAMIAITSRFSSSTDIALSTSDTQTWRNTFQYNAMNALKTATVLQYPYLPDSLPLLPPGSSDALLSQSLLGKVSIMVRDLKTDYLEPQQKAATAYSDFYNQFNIDVYSQISNMVSERQGSHGKDGNENANYIFFNQNGATNLINSFYNKYFNPVTTKTILYPPQTTSTIQGISSQDSAKQWAEDFGMSADQISRCVVNINGSYVVQIDPNPILAMRNGMPGNGDVIIQRYQAWNTGFETQVDTLKNQLQIFAQKTQNALSNYQSRNDLFSSLITAFIDSLKKVIANF